MNRRRFFSCVALIGGTAVACGHIKQPLLNGHPLPNRQRGGSKARELKADVVIIGGGMGGCAAALRVLP